MADTDQQLKCLDAGKGDCQGKVEMTSADGMKWWPRCKHHFNLRLDEQEHINELISPSRPRWFDEGAIGEHWDED